MMIAPVNRHKVMDHAIPAGAAAARLPSSLPAQTRPTDT